MSKRSRRTAFRVSRLSVVTLMHRRAWTAIFSARLLRMAALAVGVIIGSDLNKGLSGSMVVMSPGSNRSACLTVPSPSPVNPKIFTIQFVAVDAVRLPRLMSGRTISAQQVYPVRYSFKMPGIAARPIPAEMVNLMSVWNWPDKKSVRGAMRFPSLAPPCGVAVSRLAIAVTRIRPALIRPRLHRLNVTLENRSIGHEAIYNRGALKPMDAT